MQISTIESTVFLKTQRGVLAHLVRVTVVSPEAASGVWLRVVDGTRSSIHSLEPLTAGPSTHDVYLRESPTPRDVSFALLPDGRRSTSSGPEQVQRIQSPRHWVVHVVQRSHHDVGYTDIPSRVLKQQGQFLDDAIDLATETDRLPPESRFRIVIEASWSLEQFLESAVAERRKKMIRLLRAGRFELTAMFGNMTSELCGPEELIRALYPAFLLSRRNGFPVTTAECNDIPGMSWGLCRVLTDAGIRMFCPGIPLYYSWGGLSLKGAWDEPAIFGRSGPGGFLWESQAGRRLLFWCDNSGCGGDARGDLPDLANRLTRIATQGYPYRAYMFSVAGAKRDNSPYIVDFARTIDRWNQRWAYPKLICSTNAHFYADLLKENLASLPVHRGEMPGQDYPVGSTSTAAATAANRTAHSLLLSAEKLATLWQAAGLGAQAPVSHERVAQAYREMLWYDEHTWGYQFPCGPMAEASRQEKAVHAYRAHALARDVMDRVMSGMADRVRRDGEGFHLVVFNTLSRSRTSLVSTPMRLVDSSGEGLRAVPPEEDPKGSGYLRGVLLADRWHAHLPPEVLDGRFDLIDVATGMPLPWQIDPVHADDPQPYAAERTGLAAGGPRYGLFEVPRGLALELRFVARDVPACGWRVYRFAPRETRPDQVSALGAGKDWIENEYYRIEVDVPSGRIRSIIDREASRELLDPVSRYSFGQLVVRGPDSASSALGGAGELKEITRGPVTASIHVAGSAPGHPLVRQTISLHRGLRRIDCAVRILKDATPLLDASIAFPFAARKPRFRYEGVLNAIAPGEDFLPGASFNAIPVQNWISMGDGGYHLAWSSLECPIVSVGELWPSRVSPAHSCVLPPDPAHAILSIEEIRSGWIFSRIFANNFGTNFAVSQSGDALFRYSITSGRGELSDTDASWFGWDAVSPLECITTEGPCAGPMPPAGSMVAIDSEDVQLLTLKQAEDGGGLVMRLWNLSAQERAVRVTLSLAGFRSAFRSTIMETDSEERLPFDGRELRIPVAGRDMATVLLSRKP